MADIIITGMSLRGGITVTLPPAAATIVTDTYFKYTSLLLSGDGTNNATNSTFVDSSTNNFTITRNGNTTQGTLSPYTSNWSNYTTGVSGTTNKIDVSSGSAIGGSGVSYTMEGWFYFTSTVVSDNQNIFATGNSVYPNRWVLDVAVQETTLQLRIVTESNAILFNGTVVSVPLNTWVHLAAVNNNSANSFTFYINGTAAGSRAAVNLTSTSTYQLFCNSTAAGHTLPFYVSNFRIVDGSAVYTSDFTPSRSNLTAISGTKLLTFQSPTLIDNSGSGTTLTFNGTHSARKPLHFITPVGAAYSTSTIGGSAYFDGTGDRLDVATNASLQLSSSNFTIEAWVYYTTVNTYAHFLGKWNTGSLEYQMYIVTSNGDLIANTSDNGSNALTLTASGATKANAWNHIVWTRSGSTDTLYVNGVSVGSSNGMGAIYNGSSAVSIGGRQDNAYYMNGYVAGLRIVKGTVVYTGTFTPPTAPVTAITNTSLLLNYTNAGIYDAAMMNNLETVGDTKISTVQSKFGGSSIYFDGTGDYLTMPSTTNLQFGTGDFTIECWAYFNVLSNSPMIWHKVTASSGWFFEVGTNVLYFGHATASASQYYQLNTALTTSTWYHLAVTRVGTTLSIFLNGTKYSSTVSGAGVSADNSAPFIIGSYQPNSSSYDLNGYIDDLRITKGYARYTSNFSVPTAALPTQ